MTDGRDQRTTRFTRIFEDHYEDVRAYTRRRAPDLADDVAAETLAVAWRRLDDIPDPALPWLYGVARNVLCNAVRSERRRRAGEDGGVKAGPGVTPSFTAGLEEGSVMRAALENLSPADRELLLLVAWEQLDGPALAAALRCSRTAAAVRLFRARRRLEASLAVAEGPSPARAEAPAAVRKTDTRGRLLDEK
jgi:RNA polymerase sigma-70 factor, ECF subfamily